MNIAKLNRTAENARSLSRSDFGLGLLFPALVLFVIGLLGLLSWWALTRETSGQTYNEFYLLPWVGLTAAVVIAPSVYLFYTGKFHLFHPLVYPVWTYFFPAFVIGGLVRAFNITQPYYLYYIKNPEYDVPLTFFYLALGFAGLTAGFYLPFGLWIGAWVKRKTPVWDWHPNDALMPGLGLLIIGTVGTMTAFVVGILGYQKSDEIGVYDGLIYLSSFLLVEAGFFLWLAIFKTERLNFNHLVVIVVLIGLNLAKAVFSGSRGTLVYAFVGIFAAYLFSGRKIQFRQAVGGAAILVSLLLVGMIYGTAFRNQKETQAKISFGEYAEFIPSTVDALSRQDTLLVLQQGFETLAERLENVSSVAVVVSNYEDLAPYEAGYGLDNNIQKDLLSFFIPRVLWHDKPVASAPGKYGDLYFNYSENSFTITPIGDLLRNFGPWGIPLGMMFLGLILRVIYAALIENQTIAMWRATLYFMLLSIVSYEGFYGSIIPYLSKIGVVSVVGIIIIWFLMPRRAATGQSFKY